MPFPHCRRRDRSRRRGSLLYLTPHRRRRRDRPRPIPGQPGAVKNCVGSYGPTDTAAPEHLRATCYPFWEEKCWSWREAPSPRGPNQSSRPRPAIRLGPSGSGHPSRVIRVGEGEPAGARPGPARLRACTVWEPSLHTARVAHPARRRRAEAPAAAARRSPTHDKAWIGPKI